MTAVWPGLAARGAWLPGLAARWFGAAPAPALPPAWQQLLQDPGLAVQARWADSLPPAAPAGEPVPAASRAAADGPSTGSDRLRPGGGVAAAVAAWPAPAARQAAHMPSPPVMSTGHHNAPPWTDGAPAGRVASPLAGGLPVAAAGAGGTAGWPTPAAAGAHRSATLLPPGVALGRQHGGRPVAADPARATAASVPRLSAPAMLAGVSAPGVRPDATLPAGQASTGLSAGVPGSPSTHLVQGAAGLGRLLSLVPRQAVQEAVAPRPAQAAPAWVDDQPVAQPVSALPDVPAAGNGLTPAAAVHGLPMPLAEPDTDAILQALVQQLQLDYLRHYGSAG